MPDRPLLLLPSPSLPAKRGDKHGGPPRLSLPTASRQQERLGPKFEALQRHFAAREEQLRISADGLFPEDVLVLETVGVVQHFIRAVQRIDGMEWLAEMEISDLPDDSDFCTVDKEGQPRPGEPLAGRLFMLFTNQRALDQMLSLWHRWQSGTELRRGSARWKHVFAQLRDVRRWCAKDRLTETGVLDDWRACLAGGLDSVTCEIELWYRGAPELRQAAEIRVCSLVEAQEGRVLATSTVEAIAYHAILAELPRASAQTVLQDGAPDVALVQCEDVQFFRATGQMQSRPIAEDTLAGSPAPPRSGPAPKGAPSVALLDGLPMQNHPYLQGRLVVDDPDDLASQYLVDRRLHGTAMASLIVWGDLDAGELPLDTPVYVRPIMRPDPRDFRDTRIEAVPHDQMVVDVIHRCTRRLFEGERGEPAVAPSVRVINLSIGIQDRPFDAVLSPLARLLDWLAWRYRVLFVVSAGNHCGPVDVDPKVGIRNVSEEELKAAVVRAVADDGRNRRLLSPAESVNSLTVGALHSDVSSGPPPPRTLDPYAGAVLPSPISAQGLGYRRAVKPDMLAAGGRIVFREPLQARSCPSLDPWNGSTPPGQRVAVPDPPTRPATCYTRGTSNAAAITSRAATLLSGALHDLRHEPGGYIIDAVPEAVWLKAMLVHGCSWGDAQDALERVLKTPDNSRQFRAYLPRLLGYGMLSPGFASGCTPFRVTALGGGVLGADQAHTHQLPLPPSLSAKRCLRRLAVTLAWLTPVAPLHHAWRIADLWFEPQGNPLHVRRCQVDGRSVGRGTLQHEVFEGESAAAFAEEESVAIQVNCRSDAEPMVDEVPYALLVTLEVGESVDIDIYSEVRVALDAARVTLTP